MEPQGARARELSGDSPPTGSGWLAAVTPLAGLIAAVAALITAVRS